MKKLDDLDKIIDANLGKMDISEQLKFKLKNEVKNKNRQNIKKLSYIGIPIAAAMLVFAVIVTNLIPINKSSKVYADNLMENITPHKVKTVELNEQFIQSTADFSVELFKHSYKKDENLLISPASVYLALGMTANGADGSTLKEFENVLGNGSIKINDLNSYYNSLNSKLTNIGDGKLSIANSIWYSDSKNLNIKSSFLQTNADYYNASAYKEDFDSPKTVQNINNWVKNNTGNKIDKMIDKINSDTVMYLFNTIYFNNKWEKPFKNLGDQPFYLLDGKEKYIDYNDNNGGNRKVIDCMYSDKEVYLESDKCIGFIKPYKNGKYSFVGILPNVEISFDDLFSSLSGKSFMNFIDSKSDKIAHVQLPKFKLENEIELIDPLKQMGLNECFQGGKANFTKMDSKNGRSIYINDILQKTFITVTEQGTEAGASTKVELTQGWSIDEPVYLNFNRPFVYAIIDNKTKLPVFMGVVTNPEN